MSTSMPLTDDLLRTVNLLCRAAQLACSSLQLSDAACTFLMPQAVQAPVTSRHLSSCSHDLCSSSGMRRIRHISMALMRFVCRSYRHSVSCHASCGATSPVSVFSRRHAKRSSMTRSATLPCAACGTGKRSCGRASASRSPSAAWSASCPGCSDCDDAASMVIDSTSVNTVYGRQSTCTCSPICREHFPQTG